MAGRGIRLLLCLAVLAATGAASPWPCCTLQELSRPASAEVRDCCDRAGCCRVEKRGPAPAALSIKAPEVGLTVALAPGYPHGLVQEAVVSKALARQPHIEKDHPPPRGGRETHLRISLLRI